MAAQRSARRSPAVSRRECLAAAAGLGAATLGGCAGHLGVAASRPRPVAVLAAGSCQHAFENALRDAVDRSIRLTTMGSVSAARLVASGDRDPDVLVVADPLLFAAILDVGRYHLVATNALTLAVADTPGGRRVAEADRWYDPVTAGRARLGRTDPDLDPLGYRTVLALELTARRADRPDLAAAVLAPDQVYPEPALASRVETGAVDVAVCYRSMAVERGIDRVALPPAVDLSDPARRAAYASASLTLSDRTTVRGAPIRYAATRRSDRPAVRDVFAAVRDGRAFGSVFDVPEQYPRIVDRRTDGTVAG